MVARILRNRDIVTDEELDYFFNAGLNDLYDGRLLPDMDKAAARVHAAVIEHRHIRIVGDYDIDGVCATYILLSALRKAGAVVDHRIPDRINDGYGINIHIIEEAAADGVELILTCDNGIAAIDEMKRAAELGMEVVITDHHNVRKDDEGREILPEAAAIVDVKRSDSRYPFEDICGAVTAWKLIGRVYDLLGRPMPEWLDYIEFAALATVGDIMNLKLENRVIVKEGLRRMSLGSSNLGLRTLIEELGLSGNPISSYHVGFVIGPCINASGRLKTAEAALKLFMTEDIVEARELAERLRFLNEERKSMTEDGVRKGREIVEAELNNDKVIVVYIEGLHESLAGIVAGKLKEVYYKPCFVITKAKEGLKGSGRSIEAYDMFSAICEADEFLTKYGGHKMAAGLSLKEEKLDGFRAFLNEHARLNDADFIKKVWIDVPMPLSYVSERLIGELEKLQPFGNGFEKPLFACRDLKPMALRVLGRNRNALKMSLRDGDGRIFDAIKFGNADELKEDIEKKERISILYYPQINSFRGINSIQFMIEDYK